MSVPVLQISYSLSDIENAAAQLWQYAHKYNILTFSGELGAGKTSFISALCKTLGVKDNVSSPTFAIINEYHFNDNQKSKVIYHMDWYRIKDADDAVNAGVEDCLLQKESFSFIEWPEKAGELLIMPHLQINISSTGEQERTVEVFVKH